MIPKGIIIVLVIGAIWLVEYFARKKLDRLIPCFISYNTFKILMFLTNGEGDLCIDEIVEQDGTFTSTDQFAEELSRQGHSNPEFSRRIIELSADVRRCIFTDDDIFITGDVLMDERDTVRRAYFLGLFPHYATRYRNGTIQEVA